MKLTQDTKQRIGVGFSFILELYRVVTSSLLILFVPQLCIDHMCTLTENMVWEGQFYNATLIFNFFTLLQFLILYIIEIIRENRLIKYLDVNKNLPNDDDEIGKVLELLPCDKRNKIHSIDMWYQKFGYVTIVCYSVNIIMSAIVVHTYYIGNQSVSAFIVYVLFMCTKLSSVYTLARTEKNTFYSAYLKTNVQYNDIDVDLKVPTQL